MDFQRCLGIFIKFNYVEDFLVSYYLDFKGDMLIFFFKL